MSRLALALDFESRDEFHRALKRVGSERPVLKLGLRLLPHLGAQDFLELKHKGFDLFIDVKLHDIPSQVASSVKTWSSLGADFLTLHLSGGRSMIRAAVEAAQSSQTKLLGVSVLTSQDENDLLELGVQRKVSEQVLHLARMAWTEGLKGFVCSALELPMIKAEWSESFVCTPGLKLDDASESDQKRSLSYREAAMLGSDLLVIGRGIWKSPDPALALKTVMNHLKELS